MVPLSAAVWTRRQDTADTATLTCRLLDGPRPDIAPGRFMMVDVPGVGEVPISVSGVSAEGIDLTVRAVGPVSGAIVDAAPGSWLGLRGPLGRGWPLDVARGTDVVVVAGGIGLAPLRMLIGEVVARRAQFGAVRLLYGARTPADLLYGDDLRRWAEAIDVAVTVDAAQAGWRGRVGVVPKLVAGSDVDPARVQAFVCGPEVMMRFTVIALTRIGVSAERVHVSLERHMECGIGLCGHCQLGPTLICRDGPVYAYAEVAPWLKVREL